MNSRPQMLTLMTSITTQHQPSVAQIFTLLCSGDTFTVIARSLTVRMIINLKHVSRAIKAAVNGHLDGMKRIITSPSHTVVHTMQEIPKLNIKYVLDATVFRKAAIVMHATRVRTSYCGRVVMYVLKYIEYLSTCYLYVLDGVATYVLPSAIHHIHYTHVPNVYDIPSALSLHAAFDACANFALPDCGFSHLFRVNNATRSALIAELLPNSITIESHSQDHTEFFDAMVRVIIGQP